jgi:hypothetical protein
MDVVAASLGFFTLKAAMLPNSQQQSEYDAIAKHPIYLGQSWTDSLNSISCSCFAIEYATQGVLRLLWTGTKERSASFQSSVRR